LCLFTSFVGDWEGLAVGLEEGETEGSLEGDWEGCEK